MVHFKLTNFKTGMSPNNRSVLNVNNLTPTQKLKLVYCRLWGAHIGDNFKSGKIFDFRT